MNNTRISFFYQDTRIGGAQLLFARLAENFVKVGYEVNVYDEEMELSFISDYLCKARVPFNRILIDKSSLYKANKDEIFILSLSYRNIIFERFNFDNETRLIFWDLHPFALLENTNLSYFFKKISHKSLIYLLLKKIDNGIIDNTRQFIDHATQHHGLFFMSQRNAVYNRNFFSFVRNPEYLPIPIDTNKLKYDKNSEHLDLKKNEIHLCWLGRLDKDKHSMILKIIDDVIEINQKTNQKIVLYIIGEGDNKFFLQNYTKDYDDIFRYTGQIKNDEISEWLANKKIDMGIAVGTAALELAVRGIPTLITQGITLNKNDKNLSNKSYRWISLMDGYNLALTSESQNDLNIDLYNAINILFDRKENYSVESYTYVVENHSFDAVFSLLENCIKRNTFSYSIILVNKLNKKSHFSAFLKSLKKTLKKIK